MLRTTTILLSLLFFSSLFSQDIKDDINKLFEEAKYEEGLEKVTTALEASPNDTKLHQLKGNFLYRMHKLEESAEAYLKAISLEDKKDEKDVDLISRIYFSLGQCYHRLGNFHSSIRQYRKGLSYGPSDKIVADLRYNLTSAFARLGQYDSAMVHLEDVYRYDLESGDSSAISSDLNSLAYMQSQRGEYRKALDYYKQSMTYIHPNKPQMLAVRYSNIGVMHIRLGEYEKAEVNLRESMKRYETLGDSVKAISQLVNLSTMYKEMGLYPKAIDYLKEADSFFTQHSNSWTIIRTKLQLAEAYLATGRYSEGIKETDVMLSLSKKDNLLAELINTLDLRVKLFDAMNQSKQAYLTLKEKIMFADSLEAKEQLKELNELELRFVSEAKEKEIELLELENQLNQESLSRKNQEQLMLIIGIVLIVIAGLIFFFFQKKNHQLKEELLSQEIDTLRVKIDSIFGGGVKSLDMTLDDLNKGLYKALSEREYEILNEAISDKNNSEIAETLFVSVNTVKFHLRNIYDKLGVSNRKEALEFIISRS